MLTFLKRRKARREAARELAATIVEQAGDDAYSMIRLRMADLAMKGDNTGFESLVKREIDALLGVKPRTDTATRYLEENRRTKR